MKRSEFLASDLEDAAPVLESHPHSTLSLGAQRKLIRTSSGLDPYTGPWNFKTAAHLLRRTMIGPRRSEILAAVSNGLDGTMNQLMADQPPPSPPIDPSGQVPNWTTAPWSSLTATGNQNQYNFYNKQWWMGLMITQGISVLERMVLFWHNHFVSETQEVVDARYMYKQNALFRHYALGNFKELVRAITLDPAMLRYLNGNQNIKGRAQENYARELQELFTIGKGPQTTDPDDPLNTSYTNYTELDVQEAARVLTGWRDTDWRQGGPPDTTFVASNHDTGNKQFSYAYQKTKILGGGTNSIEIASIASRELDDLVNMIFAQTETAKFICRKLYRWFVYYDIDSTVEQNVITPMADIFRGNNYETKPVINALLRSTHFFDNNNIGCVIRNPVDFVAGTYRQLGLPLADPSTPAFYSLAHSLYTQARLQQLDLLDPPDVAGWKAYYQAPGFYESWINTATLPQRGAFSDSVTNGIRAGGATYRLDVVAFAKTMSDPGDPFKLIDDLANALLPGIQAGEPLTPGQKEYLIHNVFNLTANDEYEWTINWNNYQNSGDATSGNFVVTRLRTLMKFMMRMAEYQLM